MLLASRRIAARSFRGAVGTRDWNRGPRHSRSSCRAEGAYLLRDTPDAPGVAASWSIEGTLEFIEIGSGEEFVADGQTVPVEVHSDGAGGAADGRNVVGIIATLVYGEDETAGGPGCAAPEPPTLNRHHRWVASACGAFPER
ncbi:MAG: hypothetical protein CM15mP79_0560 [Methanobacteriota archaeon]|nr:MAG: hypothetical protein CM15mP79_0560 [Euryarchaeota archaeon]